MNNCETPDRLLGLLDETRESLRAIEELFGRAVDPILRGAEIELGEPWETKMRETIAQFEGKFTLLLYEHNVRFGNVR